MKAKKSPVLHCNAVRNVHCITKTAEKNVIVDDGAFASVAIAT